MNQEPFKKLIYIYSELETKLLDEIVQHFKINEEFINSDYWRIEKLKELGLLNQNIVKYIAEITQNTPKEIEKEINNIGFDTLNINNLNNAYEGGLLKIDPSILMEQNIIQNLVNYSYNELTNRFLEISNKIENSTREAYLNIVEKAYIQTSNGVTYQEAIRNCLMDLGDKGITTLTYKTLDENGNVVGIRNYDVEGAVRRELVTANHNLVNNINKTVAEELEVEYLYLSEHIKCRPTHFPWQGTIIRREDLVKVTRLGEVDGMGGPNCKHYPTLYFGTARGRELKQISLEEATEQYNLSQKQRYLERGIRKWKRRERLFKNAEDKEYYNKCKNKVKEWQLRNKKFVEDNDLRRDFVRENVERVTNVKNSGIIHKKISKEEKEVHYIGKIDKNKIGDYANRITTDEVVLTDERKVHIYQDHKKDYETIINNIDRIVLKPREVLEDVKNKDTLFFIDKLEKNNLNVIVRLNTTNNSEHPQNSVMTAWIIRDSNLRKLREKNKTIYKSE